MQIFTDKTLTIMKVQSYSSFDVLLLLHMFAFFALADDFYWHDRRSSIRFCSYVELQGSESEKAGNIFVYELIFLTIPLNRSLLVISDHRQLESTI